MVKQLPAAANEPHETAQRRRGSTALVAPRLTDEEVAAQLRVLADSARSDNTKLAYRSAVRQFLQWGGLLPTDENTLLRYLAEHASVLNARTLAHRMSALSQWHQHQGFFDPTNSARVRTILHGVARVHGTPPKKARPLTTEELEVVVRKLALDSSIAARRDNALLQLGFLGGFRRSELVRITVEDLLWEPQGLTVVLPRSKTDQLGEGLLRSIPYGHSTGLCAATALRAWLHAAAITSGHVFRPLTRAGRVRVQALSAASVSEILVQRAEESGLANINDLSAHSLRRGMATSAHRAGASREAIKSQGGWTRDETVDGYIEEADRFGNNAASAILKGPKNMSPQ